jgi:gluconokinase
MMIVILMGVSGAGKTTTGKLLAGALDWSFYEGDEFHPEANVAKMRSGIPLTDEDREDWLAALEGLERNLEKERQNAVITCSALKRKYRERLLVDNAVRFVYLKGSYELIAKRLEGRRGHFMGADLLASQFEILEEPEGVLTLDISLPPRIIVQEIRRAFAL